MKKFITRTIAFLIFSVLFYMLGIIIWGELMPPALKPNLNYARGAYGFMRTRIEELDTVSAADVLIVGSSHAYRGFDTRIFQAHGIKAFNLGSSGQTPIQSLALLRTYIKKLDPKLVLLEVNPISVSSDGVESALDLVANGRTDGNTLKMILTINQAKVYNSFLFANYRKLFNLNKHYTEPVKTEADRYIKGGYVERKMDYYVPSPVAEETIHFNEQQLEALGHCMQEMQRKNIEVVLVFAPITNHLYRSYTNTEDFDSIMKGFGRYYNFNQLVSLSDSLHFYDSNHLNQKGVQQFNQELFEVLGLED